ncbi:hypothetical protein L612_008500000040 [Rhodococcus rhodochrous J38]|nr:hypothetical protein L612_008500000040 [Rhodococcus rhodochrous J38]
MSAGTALNSVTKKAAPRATGRPDIETQEGIQMQQQLNSDDLLAAIEGLCEFYNCPETAPMLTSGQGGSWLANLAVTPQFSGPNVFYGPASTLLFSRGATLRQTLERLHDAFVAAAPSFEIVKGA